jgi:heat shock protein HslJ
MGCADGMDQEQAFLQALSAVNRYERKSGTLRLLIEVFSSSAESRHCHIGKLPIDIQ